MATVDFPNLLKLDTILFWFFLLFLIILAYLSGTIICLYKKKETTSDIIYYVLAFWMTAGFLFGYCALYTGGSWTLCRGCNTGLLFAFLLLIYVNNHMDKKILIILSLFGMVSIWGYYKQQINERYSVSEHATEILMESDKLSNIIKISEENDFWENTTAHYGVVDYRYLSLPSGGGYNYMINGEANKMAKYALISKWDNNAEKYRQMLIASSHDVTYEDDWFIILINKQFKLASNPS